MMIHRTFIHASARFLRVVLLTGIGAAVYSIAAPGQEQTSHSTNSLSVTLDQVIEEVLTHNPELNFYRAEISAAKGERQAARTWANPEFSTSAGPKRIKAGSVADEGIAWAVSVQQTFEWPGRIPLRKAIANYQVRLAELGLAQFKAALAARTRVLAYSLYTAQEKSAAAKEVADRFHELRGVLGQRDPAGLTPQLETRIIEATELTTQRRAAEALRAVQTTQFELNQLRGQPWSNRLSIRPLSLLFGPAPQTQTLLAAAKTNNFELQMRRIELDQHGLKLSLARKEGYPSFSIGPYFSHESVGDKEQQFGVGLSIPLPLWNRNKGDSQAAEARQKQAETALYLAERDLERRVLEFALTYQTKLDEMSKWRPESVNEFRKAAELADRHYRLGAVPIATYVELQKQYMEAVEALLATQFEALEAALQLQLLTGVDSSFLQTPAPEPQQSR